MALSAASVAYVYQIHLGRAPAPDFDALLARVMLVLSCGARLLMAAGRCLKSVITLSRTATYSAWMFLQFIIGAAKGLAVQTSQPFLIATAHQTLELLGVLAGRPLAVYGRPVFAMLSAFVTLAYSRIAIFALSQIGSPTRAELVELATRLGRSSQRLLFVPPLAATVGFEVLSGPALVLARGAIVPLALGYAFCSLLFVCGEARGWRATGRLLLQQRPRAAATARSDGVGLLHLSEVAPEQLFCKKGEDCSICFEPLAEPDDETSSQHSACSNDELEQAPKRAFVRVVLEESEKQRCEWILSVTAGSTYRVRLLDGALIQATTRQQVCEVFLRPDAARSSRGSRPSVSTTSPASQVSPQELLQETAPQSSTSPSPPSPGGDPGARSWDPAFRSLVLAVSPTLLLPAPLRSAELAPKA
eukprot:CAMPEP_0204166898 /NCGR_PEP_ID=MMETSP0361-20130328/39396_1 /ASSEMBLY_ACC=CAM_ASM_000343 /TAXON_ID=268821 /ORGANISM="Scrippsiella Hangoei, Strain SHTV-5" /LENGTH=417 /DNA_ID=CAMNT_0051124111 /DNA_START=68 /DNA_END=1318 /DNA_ORIENTATION=+